MASYSIAVNALPNSHELLSGRSRGCTRAPRRDLLSDLSTALNVFRVARSPFPPRIMRATSLRVTTSVERPNDSSSAPARRRSGFCPAFAGTGSIIYKRLLVQPVRLHRGRRVRPQIGRDVSITSSRCTMPPRIMALGRFLRSVRPPSLPLPPAPREWILSTERLSVLYE